MDRTRLIAGLVAVSAILAMPASAKEGVRAKLVRPVNVDAAPGRTITVAWKLFSADGQRFGASGIYLRAYRCGSKPVRIRTSEHGDGSFSARVKVPKRGLRKLVVGLEGWRITPGHRERADAFFEFDPRLVSRRGCS